jgi:hypothetical protein
LPRCSHTAIGQFRWPPPAETESTASLIVGRVDLDQPQNGRHGPGADRVHLIELTDVRRPQQCGEQLKLSVGEVFQANNIGDLFDLIEELSAGGPGACGHGAAHLSGTSADQGFITRPLRSHPWSIASHRAALPHGRALCSVLQHSGSSRAEMTSSKRDFVVVLIAPASQATCTR